MHKSSLNSAKRTSFAVWLIAACFLALGYWSSQAVLDEIVRGPGKIVPSSRTQIIQSLEGGILAKVDATEGQIVNAGAVLVRLDQTKSIGALEELEGQIATFEAKLVRLEHELKNQDELNFPSNLETADASLLDSERQLFRARTAEHVNALASIEEAIDLQLTEVNILSGMVNSGLTPRLELLNAQQQLSDLTAERSKLVADYTLSRAQEHTETLAELKTHQANLGTRKDQLLRTNLISPVRGIVNKVNITTIGGVIGPGDPILEVTPLDDELRVEAKVAPKDIAFVSPGMNAAVKFSAYDYTIYGSFPGKVVHISADTFEDEQTRDADPYYKVLIALNSSTLFSDQETLEIRPGMIADAELQVGQKTVLNYLLKPLFKTTEAFREP